MDRIAAFLDEDEVTSQVSSLKDSDLAGPNSDSQGDSGMGIENGCFKWNEVEEKGKDDKAPSSAESQVQADRRFELKDINVIFPEGALSLITGPTASGKSALLVCKVSSNWLLR